MGVWWGVVDVEGCGVMERCVGLWGVVFCEGVWYGVGCDVYVCRSCCGRWVGGVEV